MSLTDEAPASVDAPDLAARQIDAWLAGEDIDTVAPPPPPALPSGLSREALIRIHTLQTLVESEGRLIAAAQTLGISIMKLRRDLHHYRHQGYDIPPVVPEKAKRITSRRKKNKWHANDGDLLIKLETLYAAGWSLKQIAEIEEFGASKEIIRYVLTTEKLISKYKLRRQKPPRAPKIAANPRPGIWEARREFITEKYLARHSTGAIARELGVKSTIVASYISKWGLPAQRKAGGIPQASPARKLKPGDAMPPKAAPISPPSPHRTLPRPLPAADRVPPAVPPVLSHPAVRTTLPYGFASKSEQRQDTDRLMAEFLARKGVGSAAEYQQVRHEDQENYLNAELQRLNGRVTTAIRIAEVKTDPGCGVLETFKAQLAGHGFQYVGKVVTQEPVTPKRKEFKKLESPEKSLDLWWHEDGLLASIRRTVGMPMLTMHGQVINAYRTRPQVDGGQSSYVFEGTLPGMSGMYHVRAVSLDCAVVDSGLAGFRRILQRDGNCLLRRMVLMPNIGAGYINFPGKPLDERLELLRPYCSPGAKLRIARL